MPYDWTQIAIQHLHLNPGLLDDIEQLFPLKKQWSIYWPPLPISLVLRLWAVGVEWTCGLGQKFTEFPFAWRVVHFPAASDYKLQHSPLSRVTTPGEKLTASLKNPSFFFSMEAGVMTAGWDAWLRWIPPQPTAFACNLFKWRHFLSRGILFIRLDRSSTSQRVLLCSMALEVSSRMAQVIR